MLSVCMMYDISSLLYSYPKRKWPLFQSKFSPKQFSMTYRKNCHFLPAHSKRPHCESCVTVTVTTLQYGSEISPPLYKRCAIEQRLRIECQAINRRDGKISLCVTSVRVVVFRRHSEICILFFDSTFAKVFSSVFTAWERFQIFHQPKQALHPKFLRERYGRSRTGAILIETSRKRSRIFL